MKAMYHRAFETDGDTRWDSGCWVRYRAIEQVVKEQPTIEPERKHGHWIDAGDESPYYYICSECGTGSDWEDHFCRECGSKMEAAKQE